MSRKFYIKNLEDYYIKNKDMEIWCDEVSDEYHTMHELYQHRMALNIALFHAWDNLNIKVFKSKLHSDGTMFDGYFIVMAILPKGQISYHYKLKHWDKFEIPERKQCPTYDGHTSLKVLELLQEGF